MCSWSKNLYAWLTICSLSTQAVCMTDDEWEWPSLAKVKLLTIFYDPDLEYYIF